METFVRETGDMVRVLEIKAAASDLETDVRLALRKLQSQAVIRGFRPGRVPLKMIRRLYAKELGGIVVEDLVKEVYEDMVEASDQYKVLGKPREVHREYEVNGDLEVRIEFHVIPEIELKNIKGMVLDVSVVEVNDEFVDLFIKKKMSTNLKTRSLEANEKIAEKEVGLLDQVTYELAEVDQETGRVLIGRESQEKRVLDYGVAEYVGDQGEGFRELFAGHAIGSEIIVPKDSEHGSSLTQISEIESNYQIRVVDVQRFDFPEIDDEWAAKISNNEVSSSEQLKEWVIKILTNELESLNHYFVRSAVIHRMLELHPFTFSTELMYEFLNLDLENTEHNPSHPMSDLNLDMVRWDILVSAIRNQVKQEFGSATPTDKSQDKDSTSGQDPYQDVIDPLLAQFELKHIPATEWIMMSVVNKLVQD